MADIAQMFKFSDDGKRKREKENFQNYLFQSVDSRQSEEPISFYRSDFRGARLINSYFLRNNFSNADFIDCYIDGTVFENCIFKYTEIYNSYFEKSQFLNLSFNCSSIVRNVFNNVIFKDIKIISNNVQQTKFQGCIIENCAFSKASLDDVVFENTSIINADLSVMTAVNLYFNNCKFENVTIDADYLGSYFFKEQFLEKVKLKYRGKIIKLNIDKIDLLSNLFKINLEKNRYYEAINLIIQKNFTERNSASIFPFIKYSIKNLLGDSNELTRTYQLMNIFKLLEYYFNTSYVRLYDYYKVINLIENLNLSFLSLMEQIDVKEKNDRLKNLLQMSIITSEMYDNIDLGDRMLLEVTIEENDEKEFETHFEQSISNLTGLEHPNGLAYFVIEKRKGSVIYDIIIYTPLAILLINSFKKYIQARKKNNLISGLRTELASSALKKMMNQIQETHHPDEIKKILEVAQLASNLDPDTFSDDKSTQKILSLIKCIQGQPTALPD